MHETKKQKQHVTTAADNVCARTLTQENGGRAVAAAVRPPATGRAKGLIAERSDPDQPFGPGPIRFPDQLGKRSAQVVGRFRCARVGSRALTRTND